MFSKRKDSNLNKNSDDNVLTLSNNEHKTILGS
jgi:hypothetical protein